jgi:tetrahydrodipicolinate N-succinyltransferase
VEFADLFQEISILSSLITVADNSCGIPGITVVGSGAFVGAGVRVTVGDGSVVGSGVTVWACTFPNEIKRENINRMNKTLRFVIFNMAV